MSQSRRSCDLRLAYFVLFKGPSLLGCKLGNMKRIIPVSSDVLVAVNLSMADETAHS